MYSAILPWFMTVTVLILTIFCNEAGRTTGFLENYPIVNIDTLQLRIDYEAKYGPTPAIRDVYHVHMRTFCFADYPAVLGAPLVNLACTAPSKYSRFEPLTQINRELLETSSSSTSGNIPFFSEAEQTFHDTYDKLLHVCLNVYITTAIFTGVGLLVGLSAFVVGVLGAVVPIFTGSASICLLISSTMVTAVGKDAIVSLNGVNAGAHVSAGTGFLVLTWTAFALSFTASLVWYFSAKQSGKYRYRATAD